MNEHGWGRDFLPVLLVMAVLVAWIAAMNIGSDVSLAATRRAPQPSSIATTSTLTSGTTAGASPLCSLDQLHAVSGFLNGANSALGGVVLTNISGRACVLEGRPDDVEIVSGRGQLTLTQAAGGRAPSGGAPAGPIELAAADGSQAGVLLEWQNWCNGTQGPLSVEIHFLGWRASLDATPASGTDSTTTPPCVDASRPSLLLIDYVRTHDATGFP
jgi:hypothetical protein